MIILVTSDRTTIYYLLRRMFHPVFTGTLVRLGILFGNGSKSLIGFKGKDLSFIIPSPLLQTETT